MTAAEQEVNDAMHEGVTIINGVLPVRIEKDDTGRAVALIISDCKFEDNKPVPIEGTEKRLEADLIISAIGQSPDIEGLEEMGNEHGFFDIDDFYRHKTKEGHFVAGDIVRPHLLTTAIGQGSIASQSIKSFFDKVKDFLPKFLNFMRSFLLYETKSPKVSTSAAFKQFKALTDKPKSVSSVFNN